VAGLRPYLREAGLRPYLREAGLRPYLREAGLRPYLREAGLRPCILALFWNLPPLPSRYPPFAAQRLLPSSMMLHNEEGTISFYMFLYVLHCIENKGRSLYSNDTFWICFDIILRKSKEAKRRNFMP
jgi:hypothetical protein